MLIHKRKMAVGFVTAVAAFSLMLPLLGAGASGASTHTSQGSLDHEPSRATRPSTRAAPRTAHRPSGTRWTWATTRPGHEGLLYETLFLYNPVANSYVPWLAKSGTWTTPSTYTIVLRNGVTWSNGKPLTCADVAYTIMLAKTNPAVPYSNLGAYLSGVSCTNATTAVVTFSSPAYTQWHELPLARPDHQPVGLVEVVPGQAGDRRQHPPDRFRPDAALSPPTTKRSCTRTTPTGGRPRTSA